MMLSRRLWGMTFEEELSAIVPYLDKLWTSIDDLYDQVESHGWRINQTDRQSLDYFRSCAKGICNGSNRVDYLVSEIRGGDDTRQAIKGAQRMLKMRGDLLSPEAIVHLKGCSICLIEEKGLATPSRGEVSHACDQVKGPYGLYLALSERQVAKDWWRNHTLSSDDIGDEFDEQEFSRRGGIAIIHVNKLDAQTSKSSVCGFMAKKLHKHAVIALEKNPFILLTQTLHGDRTRQGLLPK